MSIGTMIVEVSVAVAAGIRVSGYGWFAFYIVSPLLGSFRRTRSVSSFFVAVEALSRAKLKPADVAAIGITNQRETAVVWDRTSGAPVYPAIVWQDRRTAGFCDKLRADGHEKLIQDRTGLLIDAYFSASKV